MVVCLESLQMCDKQTLVCAGPLQAAGNRAPAGSCAGCVPGRRPCHRVRCQGGGQGPSCGQGRPAGQHRPSALSSASCASQGPECTNQSLGGESHLCDFFIAF